MIPAYAIDACERLTAAEAHYAHALQTADYHRSAAKLLTPYADMLALLPWHQRRKLHALLCEAGEAHRLEEAGTSTDARWKLLDLRIALGAWETAQGAAA